MKKKTGSAGGCDGAKPILPWISLQGPDPGVSIVQEADNWVDVGQPEPEEAFKGWNWTELAVFLDVPGAQELVAAMEDETVDHDEAEHEALDATRDLLKYVAYVAGAFRPDSCQYLDAYVVTLGVRAFVEKLSVEAAGLAEAPVWKGLLKVKDDGQFLRFAAALLEHMWT
jgi:hypothetical protein